MFHSLSLMQFGLLAESHPYNPLWAQLGYVVQLSIGVYILYMYMWSGHCVNLTSNCYTCVYTMYMYVCAFPRVLVMSC